MFDTVLIANRGVHAIGVAKQIALARAARWAMSRERNHV